MASAFRKTFGICWIASAIFLSLPALGSNVVSDSFVARNYDTGGRLTEIANDNGITTTYSYRDDSGDVDNLIAEIDIEKTGPTTIDNLTYTYDANKNKVTETRTGPMSAYSSTTDPSGGGSGYDDEDRLTHWRLSSNSVVQSWSLSLIGNWNSMTENSVTETHTHNDAHELTSVDSDTLTYDAKGNMLTDATKTHTYTWDFDNKLDSLNDGTDTWEFEYDALGRRVRNDAASGDLVFVYAGQQVIATYDYGDNANAPDRNIVYGSYIDEPILIDKLTGSNQGLKYLHRNSQYSIVALTDDSGTVLERYRYTVYGETTILAPNGTTVRTDSEHGNPFAFTGRYYHSEFGLYHQRARIYDPKLGKFLTRDPLGYVDGMSMYKGYFAPQGLDPWGMDDTFRTYICGGTFFTFGRQFRVGDGNYQLCLKKNVLCPLPMLSVSREKRHKKGLKSESALCADMANACKEAGGAYLPLSAIPGTACPLMALYDGTVSSAISKSAYDAREKCLDRCIEADNIFERGLAGTAVGFTMVGELNAHLALGEATCGPFLHGAFGGYARNIAPSTGTGASYRQCMPILDPMDANVCTKLRWNSTPSAVCDDIRIGYSSRIESCRWKDIHIHPDDFRAIVEAPSPAVIERAPLNWSIVKKITGETRWQHVQKHGVNNTSKPLHGVFDQDPVLTVQEAWYRAQRLGIPMDETGTLVVPMGCRVGFQGGKLGTGADLPNVTIHTVDGQKIITAYPSN